MAKKEDWPKTMKFRQDPIYCCVCHQPIMRGEKYHFVRKNGTRYFHDECYREELRFND